VSPDYGRPRFIWPNIVGLAIGLGLLAAVLYWTGPWFHWLWFGIFYMNVGFWLLALMGIVITGYLAVRSGNNYQGEGLLISAGILFFVATICYMIYAPAAAKRELAQQINTVDISQLPATTQARFLPLDVARNCATNRLNISSERLGNVSAIDIKDQLDWVAPLIPNGEWNA
jgi:ABC-type transport system involved in multi-copper enzyme maturation permease subunit